MTMEALRAQLRQKQRLPVAVLCTPAADALVADATGLSVVDLLRPLALVNNLNGARACVCVCVRRQAQAAASLPPAMVWAPCGHAMHSTRASNRAHQHAPGIVCMLHAACELSMRR